MAKLGTNNQTGANSVHFLRPLSSTSIKVFMALICLMVFASRLQQTPGCGLFGVLGWPNYKPFKAGDELLFSYKNGTHNVVQVNTVAQYSMCELPRNATVWSSGKDHATLARGMSFFVCGIPGHCQKGMKIAQQPISSSRPKPASPFFSSLSRPSSLAHLLQLSLPLSQTRCAATAPPFLSRYARLGPFLGLFKAPFTQTPANPSSKARQHRHKPQLQPPPSLHHFAASPPPRAFFGPSGPFSRSFSLSLVRSISPHLHRPSFALDPLDEIPMSQSTLGIRNFDESPPRTTAGRRLPGEADGPSILSPEGDKETVLDRFGSPERDTLRPDGPPGLFSPLGLYTHKPPSTLSPEEQPCAPNWVAPEPRLSLEKKFEALSNSRNPETAQKHPQPPPILDPIHTKSPKIPMAGGEGSSRGKGSKRKAEAMKEVVTTEKAAPAGDMPIIEDPISDWPTSILKEKHIKALEADGFLPAQEISRWRSAHGHEYPTEDTEEITYEARRTLYVSLPPLDPTNTEEAALLARCVDPKVRDQDPDEPMVKLEPQVPEEPQSKLGATSRGAERSKRPAPTEPAAPPRPRTIPEERAKVSPQPRTSSSVGIAIGEIGTSLPQQSSSAQQPLSDEEILHNIFNPASAPFVRTTPIIEEPCPAGPSATEQEVEEEFTLGEPEIPMRPSTMEEPPVDHAAVEPEVAVPEEPRVVPETTLPEVQAAVPSHPPAPEGTQVEETVAEVLADIEQLVTQAVIEESELERPSQKQPRPGRKHNAQGGNKQKHQPKSRELKRSPENPGVLELKKGLFILDAEEDEQHIDRGLYHAERAVAYFKKELEREREDRKLQEAEDADMIRTLHLRTKELAAEKEDMKKKLATAKAELKGVQQQLSTTQSKMADWSNLANRQEEALKTLSADHESLKEELRVAVKQRKDADAQLIQVLEQQQKLAKDLEDAREEKNQLSRELVQAQGHLADKKVLDEKLEEATRRMSELEETLRLMKKSDDDLAEALNRISLLEKAANPVVKALVPEDPAAPLSFLERLKAMPRQLKAYIKRSSKACLVHVLAVVKSRYPEVDIGKLVEGVEPNCTESAFRDLKQEAEPVAEAIAQSLRL
ncbi:hypothetical protein HU200_042372 [Digitaria exilis]|uniref:Phytocyanin domain-containing protein n=1 Tax=Digitaria exilis TaxID=1010633 RepID=A0A835EIF0_9POAL|nr:hypothetical protein HU200_042372 [Digitaria exilis]